MSCNFLYVSRDGFAGCDCASSKAGGQINDKGICDPKLCKLPKKAREVSEK